ncbi:MAG TPA: insulinase family protein [Candidatus Marinimicrobia bacterium]|nr:insulinase family protein [Candidatus Neomarinimicrobiota bacterium]
MKKLQIILFILVLGVSSSCNTETILQQADSRSQGIKANLPVDPKVKIGELENGLRYYIRENQKPKKRAVLWLAINAGSVLEDDNQQGLAHLVEHMAFNGTKHFEKQELVDYLESIGTKFGPDLNAHTSFDETVYKLQVPSDSTDYILSGLQILEDWAHGLLFDENEIDKERGVVTEEWRTRQGAGARMWNKVVPILFNNSQYAKRLPIGQIAVIDTAHYETIKKFYQDWYRPDLMALIAVGDFDSNWIEELIKTYFSRIPVKNNPRERIVYPVPDHQETLIAIATDPEASGTRISINYKHPLARQYTEEDYRNTIIQNLYTGMLNKRLEELTKLSDPPMMYGYSYFRNMTLSKASYVLGAAVREDRIHTGLATLLIEAERVRRHGFTSTELERQKMEVLRRIEKSYDERDKTESKTYVREYVRNFLEEEPISGIEYELELYKRFIPEIAIEEINNLAKKWVTDHNRVVTVYAPEKEGLTIPTEDELLAVFSEIKSIEIEPYMDKVSDEPLVAIQPEPSQISNIEILEDIGVEIWTLTNGIRVILKSTDFKNDEILFYAYSPGGTSLAPTESYVPASTADWIISDSGLGPFSQIELQKKLSGKIINISPYLSDLYEGLSGSASPKDMETLFQLIYLYFTAPRRDETAFQAILERGKGFLENRSARPESAFEDTVKVTMAQYHPRQRPWSLQLLNEMELDKSFSFYQDRFADASDFTFFFVGNFDRKAIAPRILTYLGGLPTVNRKETWENTGIDPPQGIMKKHVYRGMEEKSITRIIFSGNFEWSRENRYTLKSMTQAFRIKLREVLREDMSGVYGVGVRAKPKHYPEGEYTLSISFGCAPDRVEELTNAVFQQIDSLKTTGLTDKYLTKVKEKQRRERETNLKENRFWLNVLKTYDMHNEDFLDILEYEKLIEKLSLGNIQKAANQYFNVENYVQITLYPENSPGEN